MQLFVTHHPDMKLEEHKKEGSKILWIFSISAALIAVAVMASIFIGSKEQMKKKAVAEKNRLNMHPISQQPVQQKRYEPKQQSVEPTIIRREIRKTGGQSKESCLQQSNGTFDNNYVKCREGESKEVWVRVN